MQNHPVDLTLDDFDTMPRLTEIAPTIRAVILLYYQGDYAIGLTARRMEQDEETGLELNDSLDESKKYLRALAVVVENADLTCSAAIAA